MHFFQHVFLPAYHTFRLPVYADEFFSFHDLDSLKAGLQRASRPEQVLVLGGGSNVLFTRDWNGAIAWNLVKGIRKIHEDNGHVYLQCGAGENWHGFVQHCIRNAWGGVENLSLIPGCVGASPIQNIGAYGCEVKDVIDSVSLYDRLEDRVLEFSAADCAFGYRDSVFKHEWKGRAVIMSVTFRLTKHPVVNTSYGAIRDELERMGVAVPGIREVSEAVIRIRRSKLPDPAVLGNAGSFFKNPEIASSQFAELQRQFPGIVGYTLPGERVKLAAGWLIEQAGWKGVRHGDAGCHEKQALVLVNFGNATGNQLKSLSEEIQSSVRARFGVSLEPEVNIF